MEDPTNTDGSVTSQADQTIQQQQMVLNSLVPLRLAVTPIRDGGYHALTQSGGLWFGSEVMNGVEKKHFSDYYGYPQLKRMSTIGNELHANQ